MHAVPLHTESPRLPLEGPTGRGEPGTDTPHLTSSRSGLTGRREWKFWFFRIAPQLCQAEPLKHSDIGVVGRWVNTEDSRRVPEPERWPLEEKSRNQHVFPSIPSFHGLCPFYNKGN